MNWLELGLKTKAAVEAGVKAAGKGMGAASVAVLDAVKSWEPKIKGVAILTPALRAKLGSALGHLAFNVAAAEKGGKVE